MHTYEVYGTFGKLLLSIELEAQDVQEAQYELSELGYGWTAPVLVVKAA